MIIPEKPSHIYDKHDWEEDYSPTNESRDRMSFLYALGGSASTLVGLSLLAQAALNALLLADEARAVNPSQTCTGLQIIESSDIFYPQPGTSTDQYARLSSIPGASSAVSESIEYLNPASIEKVDGIAYLYPNGKDILAPTDCHNNP
jgi:hypothetical protein